MERKLDGWVKRTTRGQEQQQCQEDKEVGAGLRDL